MYFLSFCLLLVYARNLVNLLLNVWKYLFFHVLQVGCGEEGGGVEGREEAVVVMCVVYIGMERRRE